MERRYGLHGFGVLLLGCLLVIGCQTTHPAGKPQTGSPAQKPAAQAQAQQAAGQEQAAGQGQAAAQGQGRAGQQAPQAAGRPRAPAIARNLAAGSAKFVSGVSSQINTLFNKVKSLVKKPRQARPSQPFRPSPVMEKVTSTLRSFRLPSADILPTLAAAAILLGGGSLALAAILSRRRRG